MLSCFFENDADRKPPPSSDRQQSASVVTNPHPLEFHTLSGTTVGVEFEIGTTVGVEIARVGGIS